jgi:hypothetical protein
MVKFLGELYNYRMVESSLIFITFYTLITYGVTYDRKQNEKNKITILVLI